jgi:hypothetical protein
VDELNRRNIELVSFWEHLDIGGSWSAPLS